MSEKVKIGHTINIQEDLMSQLIERTQIPDRAGASFGDVTDLCIIQSQNACK